jgi:hypothetical protein
MEKLRQGPMLHLGIKGLDDGTKYYLRHFSLLVGAIRRQPCNILGHITVCGFSGSLDVLQTENNLNKRSRYKGHAVTQLVISLEIGTSRLRFPMGSLRFYIDLIHPAAL